MKFALVNGRLVVVVQKLNRVFDGDDVIRLGFVNQADDGCQRRTLAAAGRAGYEHDAILKFNDGFQLFRKIELFKMRRPVRYDAHDDGMGAALHEDVDAKTGESGGAVRNVGRAVLLEIS